jgi:hypothetical protein
MPSLLGVGSGLLESSSLASSLLVAAASSSRPVPAKSAFMCFCEAKGTEERGKSKTFGCLTRFEVD